MRWKYGSLTFIISLVLLISACDDNDSKCKFADTIDVQEGCYEATQGLSLTASGFDKDNPYFQWEVYVLAETTDGITDNDSRHIYDNENIVIEDGIIQNNNQIVARLITNCDGILLYSKYFKFVKSPSAGCTTWIDSDF